MSVRVNACVCVYMCVCVCTRSYNSWTAAAMDFNIIFTDRDKPFFILYFQAVPRFLLQMCSSRSSRTPTPPPHVSLRREARISAQQAGFPLFSAVTGGFPGLHGPPSPQPPLFQSRSSPHCGPLPSDSSRLGPRPSQQPSPGC